MKKTIKKVFTGKETRETGKDKLKPKSFDSQKTIFKRAEMQEKLPEMIQEAKKGIDYAKKLLKNAGNSSDFEVNALITYGQTVKDYLYKYCNYLQLTPKDYDTMRKDFNSARDLWQKSQGIRIDNTASLAMMAGVSVYDTLRKPSDDDIRLMKRTVVESTLSFLKEAGQKLQEVNQKLNPQKNDDTKAEVANQTQGVKSSDDTVIRQFPENNLQGITDIQKSITQEIKNINDLKDQLDNLQSFMEKNQIEVYKDIIAETVEIGKGSYENAEYALDGLKYRHRELKALHDLLAEQDPFKGAE